MTRTADLALDLAAALDPVILARAAGITPYPWQKKVLRSKAKMQALRCSRQSGKSTVTSVKTTHKALYHAGSLTLILSPSERQSKLLLDKTYKAYRSLGQPIEADAENQLYLKLMNGSEIYALPGKEATIRGFSGVDLLIIDEASRAADGLYYALTPMLAASDGELMLLSSPFGKRGFFFEEWVSGGDDWDRTTVTADQVPHFSPEFLERERKRNPLFLQEYMCEFLDSVGQVFAHDLIDRAFAETPGLEPLFALPQGDTRWVTDQMQPLPTF